MPRLTIGLIAIVALTILVAPRAVEAQRPSDVRRIGYLRPGGSGPQGGFEDILRAGLRDRGYMAQTQHLNHEPPTACNTLLSNELQRVDLPGHRAHLRGVS